MPTWPHTPWPPIITVHVEDGRLGNLAMSVREILERAQVISGETHLVVHHDMDGPPFYTPQLRILDRLVHHPLPGNGRITVNHDGQHFVVIIACSFSSMARAIPCTTGPGL